MQLIQFLAQLDVSLRWPKSFLCLLMAHSSKKKKKNGFPSFKLNFQLVDLIGST